MSKLLNRNQLKTLFFGLRGRKEIPMKYEYLGKGAKNWTHLIKSSSYGIGMVEEDLIKKNLPTFFNKFLKFNLVDLGPGDGGKTIPIINFLKQQNRIGIYCMVDISKDMMNLAKKKIIKETKYLNIISKVSDFEEGNFVSIAKFLKKEYAPVNFLLLLGNTVGNQFDRYRVLLNIRESMSMDDFLLIGLELRKNDHFEEIVNHYKIPEIYEMITSNLDDIGISKDSGDVEILVNNKMKQVEAWFVLKKKMTLNFQNEKFVFNAREKILLMISYKAKVDEFKNILHETGFNTEKSFVSTDRDYALFLCKPRPFDFSDK